MPSQITQSSPLRESMWRTGLILQAEIQTNCEAFSQPGDSTPNSAFPVEERAGSKRGETLTMRFSRPNMDEVPKVDGDETLGKESGTEYLEDSLQMRYFKFDGALPNYIVEQQLVSFNRKASEVERLGVQWAYLKEKVTMNQLGGATQANGEADDALGGGNTITALDANHQLYAEGASAHTTAAGVAGDSTAVLTSEIIDLLVMRCVNTDYVLWPVPPCKTPFGDLYVFWVSPEGYKQIRANTADSDIYDLERAMIEGGGDPDMSAMISGEGFIYNKTLVLRTAFSPQTPQDGDPTTGQANTKQAIFHGARAGHWIYGEAFTGGNHIGYSEHLQHRRLSIMTDTCWGFKRTIVDGESWATFAVCHYASV